MADSGEPYGHSTAVVLDPEAHGKADRIAGFLVDVKAAANGMRTVLRGIGAPKWVGEVITEFAKGEWGILSTEQNGDFIRFAVRGVYAGRPNPVDSVIIMRIDDLMELTPIQLFPMFPTELREILQRHIDKLGLNGPRERQTDALATR